MAKSKSKSKKSTATTQRRGSDVQSIKGADGKYTGYRLPFDAGYTGQQNPGVFLPGDPGNPTDKVIYGTPATRGNNLVTEPLVNPRDKKHWDNKTLFGNAAGQPSMLYGGYHERVNEPMTSLREHNAAARNAKSGVLAKDPNNVTATAQSKAKIDAIDNKGVLGGIGKAAGNLIDFMTYPHRQAMEMHKYDIKKAEADIKALNNQTAYYQQLQKIKEFEYNQRVQFKGMDDEIKRLEFMGRKDEAALLKKQRAVQSSVLDDTMTDLQSSDPTIREIGLLKAGQNYSNAMMNQALQKSQIDANIARAENYGLQRQYAAQQQRMREAKDLGLSGEPYQRYIQSNDPREHMEISRAAGAKQQLKNMRVINQPTNFEVDHMDESSAIETINAVRAGLPRPEIKHVEVKSQASGGLLGLGRRWLTGSAQPEPPVWKFVTKNSFNKLAREGLVDGTWEEIEGMPQPVSAQQTANQQVQQQPISKDKGVKALESKDKTLKVPDTK